MVSYDFTLTFGDRNVGTVYLPNKEATNIPVIIYCHGWGGGRRLWTPTERLCERAIKENIALVTFDFFGCGETGGDYSQMTYTRWKNNLFEIVSWVALQSFTDKNKIGCYAFSSGSTAALRLAAEDSRIAYIISVGTCISSHIGMGSGGPAKILADNYEELISGGTKEIFGVPFGLDFYIDAVSNAPIHTMKKIKCPLLFVQGLTDNPYRCADAKIAQQLMKREGLSSTLFEIQDGNHELDNVIDEALDYIFDWLIPVVYL